MPRRVMPLLPALWAMIAACSPAAPAGAVEVQPALPTPPPALTPTVNEPPAITPTVHAASPRPATAGWRSFEDGDLVGFKDAQGEVVLAPRYRLAQEFTAGGMACVVEGEGWVCIDGNGAPLLRPFIFDNGPDEFSEGLARFVEGDKFGFFDDTGHKQIPARFSFALPFADQRAAFCDGCTRRCEAGGEHCSMSGGKWGLIDRTGTQIVAASFDEIGPFVDGIAHAVKDGQALTINRDGLPDTPRVQQGG